MKTLHIQESLHKELKKLAIDKGKNLREWIEEILVNALRQEHLKVINEITSKSKLTEEEAEQISNKIKSDIWERHKKFL